MGLLHSEQMLEIVESILDMFMSLQYPDLSWKIDVLVNLGTVFFGSRLLICGGCPLRTTLFANWNRLGLVSSLSCK